VGADSEPGLAAAVEANELETLLTEPSIDPGKKLRVARVSCPDHNGAGGTEATKVTDSVVDVVVGDVAEHATHEHEVGGYAAFVDGGPGCVVSDDIDLQATGCPGGLARPLCVALIEFDQPGADVETPGMLRQHTEEIPSFPGAHADRPDGSGRGRVEGVADPSLHHPQAPTEARVRLVVGVVPLHPVTFGHRDRT
jgi:hypothetical protein